MDLRVLTDNNTFIDEYYLGEPALCFYIEEGGKRYLLDAGYSDVFCQNADAMGIPWRDVDAVLISHCHNDHTGGLSAFPAHPSGRKPGLVAHPSLFRMLTHEGLAVGCPLSAQDAASAFDVTLSKDPVWLSENLVWLGEIPCVIPFEPALGIGWTGTQAAPEPDLVADDTALAYRAKDGLVILTGCSHAGICNIIEHARRVTGVEKLLTIAGGFHLFENDARTAHTIDNLARTGMTDCYPCHCTSFQVKANMNNRLNVHEVGVNMALHWD